MVKAERMRAWVKAEPRPGFEYREVPIPRPGWGEVLIEVLATTICGSDLHVYRWNEWAQHRIKPPLIVGHEAAGRIIQVGEGVTGKKVGDFVGIETHIVCHHCRPCRTGNRNVCSNLRIVGIDRPGSYAQYLVIPAYNAVPTDPSVHPVMASMQEPFGNAVDTVLAEPVVGRSVLVTGCGPIGLMAISVARASGADWIVAVEPNPIRRSLAIPMGADIALDPAGDDIRGLIMKQTEGEGIEVVLEMSGNEKALNLGLDVLANGGRVSLLGLSKGPVTVDLTDNFIFKAARMYGITGRRMFDTWFKVQSLIRGGHVDWKKLVTHEYRLEDLDQAMEKMMDGSAAKIALYPHPDKVVPLGALSR